MLEKARIKTDGYQLPFPSTRPRLVLILSKQQDLCLFSKSSGVVFLQNSRLTIEVFPAVYDDADVHMIVTFRIAVANVQNASQSRHDTL
jgi:hypothetical protein